MDYTTGEYKKSETGAEMTTTRAQNHKASISAISNAQQKRGYPQGEAGRGSQ